ncbi:class A beta-lactamase [Streptomyces sp. NPDC001941]|uniref:class A beta-lactamase n=1 Tax=Streptomyces sp. NPDC001941 TaxID=3154659 RepID=UPI0033164DBC
MHPYLNRARAALLAAALLVPTAACGARDAPAPGARPTASSPAARPSGAARAVRELARLESAHGVRLGAYALDTGSGRAVSYRAGERFPSLSTFKAIAAAAVLDRARRERPGLMERTVRWGAADEVANSPVTAGRGRAGMTVAELCRAAVTRSDNTAGNLLLRQLGGPRGLTAYYRSLGDRTSRLDRWEPELNDWRPGEPRDTTTAAAMGAGLRAVAVGDALAPADRERLNGWLRGTATGGARIRAGLPRTWRTGDKTGTNGGAGAANDIAVTRPPSGAPVVVSVFTHRTGGRTGTDDAVLARAAAVLVRGLGRTS